jgi:hypothetical protein
MSSRFDQLRIWRASVGNRQVSHVLLGTIPGARVDGRPGRVRVHCADGIRREASAPTRGRRVRLYTMSGYDWTE